MIIMCLIKFYNINIKCIENIYYEYIMNWVIYFIEGGNYNDTASNKN
jgi:hypothetical protein